MKSDQSVGAGADRVLYVLATLARHDGPLSIAALAEETGYATRASVNALGPRVRVQRMEL